MRGLAEFFPCDLQQTPRCLATRDREAVAGRELTYPFLELGTGDALELDHAFVHDVGAQRRDDLPTVPDEWAFVADTGLRFSLWAPPRPR